MGNRFGLKDFIVIVLLLAVGISLWLNMFQEDRRFRDTRAIADRVQSLESLQSQTQTGLERLQGSLDAVQRQLNDVGNRLESGVKAVAAFPHGGSPGSAPGPGPQSGAPADRDESWARPGGVPVVWSGGFKLESDPRGQDGFAEGGEFIQIFEAQPPILTPYRYADTYGRYVNDEIVESLGRYNPRTLKLEGVLAEAWQMDPEGRWLRVLIQRRARFSDGEPVKAEDVVWTHNEFLYNAEIQADRFRSVYNAMAEVKPVPGFGGKVVDITFKEPRFDNLQQAFGMPIVPKHFYSKFSAAQINQSTGLTMGSGPFRMAKLDPQDQWKPPEDLVLVRNEQYWGPRPALDRVRFKVINDTLARFTAFRNRVGDMARPSSQQFDSVRNDAEFNKRFQPAMWYNMQGGWAFVAWQCGPRNGKLTPFSDKRVRLAMTHLIDRERLIRDVDKDLARIATGPFNSETPQADPSIKAWPYDLAVSRRLLDEAGWKDRNGDGVLENDKGERFSFQLTYASGNPATEQRVTYIKDQCAKVGIACVLEPIDWSVTQSRLDKRDFDAITFAWSSSAPESDPTQLWAISSIDGTGDNFVQWRNEQADALIKEGRKTIDFDARMKVWHRLHRVIHEDQPYTPIMELPWLRLINRRIHNFQPHKSGMEMHEFFIPRGMQASP
ncbi:MAG: hypothetical protein IBJ11_02455 [Phycisphaerales bacterium]|nr:hypothetical protein [Phycisphaerales bacterium]